jgi:hypothetical protein
MGVARIAFSIARNFSYTHIRHLWNIFKDRIQTFASVLKYRLNYMVLVITWYSYFNFFFNSYFFLKSGGGEDAWFVPSLSALMFSNTDKPMVTPP